MLPDRTGDKGTRQVMAIDPKGTFESARGHAHRARKSAGRLAVSGLGFSVAYFFDPDHGSARRKHAVEMVSHVRRAKAHVKSRRGQRIAPTTVMPTEPGSAASLRPVTNGSRVITGS
jgi:hypothetical protein